MAEVPADGTCGLESKTLFAHTPAVSTSHTASAGEPPTEKTRRNKNKPVCRFYKTKNGRSMLFTFINLALLSSLVELDGALLRLPTNSENDPSRHCMSRDSAVLSLVLMLSLHPFR